MSKGIDEHLKRIIEAGDAIANELAQASEFEGPEMALVQAWETARGKLVEFCMEGVPK